MVVHAVKILARLLVVHGSDYSKKFSDKNGGYTALAHHLKRWWNIPALWPICLSILFGQDIALMNLNRQFDAPTLINMFLTEGDVQIAFPEMLPVIMGMLKSGLRSSVLAVETSDREISKPGCCSTKLQMSLHSLNGMFPKLRDVFGRRI